MGPVFPLTDFLSSAPFRTPYPVRRFVHLLVVYRRPLHGKDPRVGLSALRRSISHAALARHFGGWGIPWPRALVPAETVDRGRRTVPAAALRGASIGHRQVIGHILGPPHTGRTHTFPSAPQHPLSPWHGGGGASGRPSLLETSAFAPRGRAGRGGAVSCASRGSRGVGDSHLHPRAGGVPISSEQGTSFP